MHNKRTVHKCLPPDWHSRTRRTFTLLVPSLLLPGQALAEMGNFTDGFLYTLVAIGLVGLLAWTLVSWFVYRSMRAHGVALRVGVAFLVWSMPAWSLLGARAFVAFEGRPRAPEIVAQSSEPQTLLELEFPAGSRLEYAHDRQHGRSLVGAWGKRELDFSGLKIFGLRLGGVANDSRLRVQLSQAQLIDGWLCSTQEEVGLEFTQSAYGLSHCILAEQTVGDARWPEGTSIRRDDEGWALVASTVRGLDAVKHCERPIVMGTARYVMVMAHYDWEKRNLAVSASTHCP